MKPEDIKEGLNVITSEVLNRPETINLPLSDQRKSSQLARVYARVAKDSNAWWLVHAGATTHLSPNGTEMIDKAFIAPYLFTEFNPTKDSI